MGDQVEGRLVRSNYVWSRSDDTHDKSEQYGTQADDTGRKWLAVVYDYVGLSNQ